MIKRGDISQNNNLNINTINRYRLIFLLLLFFYHYDEIYKYVLNNKYLLFT